MIDKLETFFFPSTAFGLNRELRFTEKFLNDRDWISSSNDYLHSKIEHEFSDKNKQILGNVIEELKNQGNLQNILEIGIARSFEWSSTYFLLKNKPDHTKYVGIDLNHLCTEALHGWNFPNTYSKIIDSSNFEDIKLYLKTLGIEELDLLIIDGWHSIEQVYRDFKFASMLKKGGYVLFHDTNYHPGPWAITQCADPDIFEAKKYFEGEEDWGVATFKRIN
jgi:hypothetical protein